MGVGFAAPEEEYGQGESESSKREICRGRNQSWAAVPRTPSSSDAALGDSAAINECARFEKRSGAPPLYVQ